ncbi:hypothetical protein LK462_06870 [Burkholderia vietnamiensis]|nr:hypothetical protein [Burkholderia vietnamiensis]UEC03221.1 hypothetical protein LK462_06870 [Burkholderia vietnamiensis]
MERALAQRSLYTTDPNQRMGYVLVKNGVVRLPSFPQWAGSASNQLARTV